MSQAQAISKGILSVGAAQVAKIVASALAAPLLARSLEAEGYGQYAYYLALIAMAWPLANLGTFQLLSKYIAERADDVRWRSQLASFAFIVNSVGTLCAASLVALVVLARADRESHTAWLAAVVVGIIICEQAMLLARGVLHGLQREELSNLPAALGSVCAAVIGIVLVLSGWGVLGALLGIWLTHCAVALITLRSMRQFVVWRFDRQLFTALPVANLLWFGFTIMLFATLGFALYRADAILIRHWSDDAQAGLYAMATQWSEFIWVVPLAVQQVMPQATARLWAEQRVEQVTQLLSRMLRYVALSTALLLIIVFVFAEQILSLYFGAQFASASTALRLLIPGVFSYSLARVMWSVIQARGNAAPTAVVMALATIANLTLNWFLMPTWGAAGAALSSGVTYGLVVFAYVWLLRGYGVQPFTDFPIGRLLGLCAITSAAVAPIAWLAPSALIALLSGGLVAALVYGLGALRLGLFRVDEMRRIIDSLPTRFRTPSAKIFAALQPTLARIEA